MKNNQKFISKFISAFFILAFIKIITILSQFFKLGFWEVILSLAIFIVVAIIILVIILEIEDSNKNKYGRKSGNNSGSFVLNSTIFDKIRSKYENLAKEYISEKQYIKAAKIYMNLLKDNYRGAKTLENGGLYNEAAAVYLNKLKNKSEAASCFDKAKQYLKAIKLYKEMGQKELVGDIYLKMNDEKNANLYYQMVIEDYVQNGQMVKASLIYRKKMNSPHLAQDILLKGWEEGKDAYNCLNNYFANVYDLDVLKAEIQKIYNKTPEENKNLFLQIIKHEFTKDEKLEEVTKQIAYEIIAENVASNPAIINELAFFNPNDETVKKDILLYKTSKNKNFR